jgi:hypothetical protein
MTLHKEQKGTVLNAQLLETFTVLCETGHFTRAADLLDMTLPQEFHPSHLHNLGPLIPLLGGDRKPDEKAESNKC